MARSVTRSSHSRRLLGLAASAALAVALTAGCDTDAGRADKRVDDDLARAAAAAHGTAAEQAEAHKDLDAASKEANASLPQQVRAKAMLADAELATAHDLASQVSANDLDIDRLAREIGQLGHAIAADTQLAAAIGKFQPDPVLGAIKQGSTALAGSDDQPDFYKGDNGSLASLAATDKNVATTQGQIDQLTQQVAAETAQRTDVLAKGDQAGEQSEREHGQKSVDLFVQSADARKQAGDLAVKIAQDNAALTRARADLALLNGQQEVLKASAKVLDDRGTEVNQNWAALGEQVKASKAHSQAVLGDQFSVPAAGKPDAKQPATIEAKATQMADLVKRNHGLREEALTHYNAALGFYGDAYDRATKLNAMLSDPAHLGSPERQERADRDAWKAEQAAVDPAGYRYLIGTTQLDRAEFYARAAAEARTVDATQTMLKPVLDAAGLTVPPPLADPNGQAAADLTSNQKLAADGFKTAIDELTKITDGSAPQELKAGAYAEAMFAQYGWAMVDPSAKAEHLSAAKTARDNAVTNNAALPGLPLELSTTGATAADATAAATPPPASVVGIYKGQRKAKSGTGMDTVVQTMNADGTFTAVLQESIPGKPGMASQITLTGVYTVVGDQVTSTAQTANGVKLPAGMPGMTDTATLADGGKQLTSSDGPPLVKQ